MVWLLVSLEKQLAEVSLSFVPDRPGSDMQQCRSITTNSWYCTLLRPRYGGEFLFNVLRTSEVTQDNHCVLSDTAFKLLLFDVEHAIQSQNYVQHFLGPQRCVIDNR